MKKYILDAEFNPENIKGYSQFYSQTYFDLDEALEEFNQLINEENVIVSKLKKLVFMVA